MLGPRSNSTLNKLCRQKALATTSSPPAPAHPSSHFIGRVGSSGNLLLAQPEACHSGCCQYSQPRAGGGGSSVAERRSSRRLSARRGDIDDPHEIDSRGGDLDLNLETFLARGCGVVADGSGDAAAEVREPMATQNSRLAPAVSEAEPWAVELPLSESPESDGGSHAVRI
jgi:hypothetical protein